MLKRVVDLGVQFKTIRANLKVFSVGACELFASLKENSREVAVAEKVAVTVSRFFALPHGHDERLLITDDGENSASLKVNIYNQLLVMVFFDLRVEELSEGQNIVSQIRALVCKTGSFFSNLVQHVSCQCDREHRIVT
jgi:hypothetical protein